MKTVALDREKIYTGNLLLVNSKYPCIEKIRTDLVPAVPGFPGILLQREAANALQLILKEISSGDSIVPVSAYRTSEEQTKIYRDSLKDNGEEFTRKYVALPNHSEHQTGLAIDLGFNKPDIDFIRPDFPYDGICDKFRKAAPDYGFILRYTAEKENITGISHEPWHFRYVGYPHSKIITESGLSLEEYIEFVKAFRAGNRLVWAPAGKTETTIYYVPLKDGKTVLEMPERTSCRISGNNADGFIVTVRR